MNILLVEDNLGDAVLVKEAIAATGSDQFNISHVETLAAALEILTANDTDLVLLDLSLTDSFGLDTLSAVLAVSEQTPIIIVSGLDDEKVAALAVLSGAQDYLVKGKFTPLSLVLAIQRTMGRHSHQLLKDVLDRMYGVLNDTNKEIKNLRNITKDIT